MREPLNKYTLAEVYSQGWFGSHRKYDIHTGIDLYCDEGEIVYAIEDGEVINVSQFTGGLGINGENESPWWNETQAIQIKGKSGIILYGEIKTHIPIGHKIKEGDCLGSVMKVLKKDKGLPMSMLHLELYEHEYVGDGEWWYHGNPKPKYLINPQILLPKYSKTYNWNDIELAFKLGKQKIDTINPEYFK